MLRDRNCDKNFERTLLAEISRAKIAARKMHNNRMTGYEDPRAERDFHRAILENREHSLSRLVECVKKAYRLKLNPHPQQREWGFLLSTI